MADWHERLRRAAALTGRAYLVASIVLIGASAYEQGYALRRHIRITWEGDSGPEQRRARSSDVAVFTDAQGRSHSIDCTASDSKPPPKSAPRLPKCADVGLPESHLKGTWDWGLAEFYGGRAMVYLAITYAFGWAVFRGLRWAALGGSAVRRRRSRLIKPPRKPLPATPAHPPPQAARPPPARGHDTRSTGPVPRR